MEKLSALRILPVLMIVAAVCFGVRVSEVMGRSVTPSDIANIEPAAGEPAKTEAAKTDVPKIDPPSMTPAQKNEAVGSAPPSEAELDAKVDAAKPKVDAPALGAPPKVGGQWKGADDLDDEYSEVKMELFNDLAKRRKDIEIKEKDVAMREALLKAGQTELEQKYKELTTIKTDIEDLLKKQTEQEDKRIASLVKIYEGMKAKDAARIFDSLDMDVLLQVITKMSERKSAPIIAAMDAEKARNVTIMLAEQNKLPSLPSLGGNATR